MAKDPAFLFYPGDYIGGTMGMTFEEKGAYVDLLMLQFNRGHMTSHMIAQTVGRLWEKIQDKFVLDNEGKFFNERLHYEIESRKSYTKSRRNNLSGKNQYTNKEENIENNLGHMTFHMENENKDTIINKEGICHKMINSYKKVYEGYYSDPDTDLPSTFKIAKHIASKNGWAESTIVNGKMESILSEWDTIIDFTKSHSLYSNFSIQDLEKKWTGVMQSLLTSKNKSAETNKKINKNSYI